MNSLLVFTVLCTVVFVVSAQNAQSAKKPAGTAAAKGTPVKPSKTAVKPGAKPAAAKPKKPAAQPKKTAAKPKKPAAKPKKPAAKSKPVPKAPKRKTAKSG